MNFLLRPKFSDNELAVVRAATAGTRADDLVTVNLSRHGAGTPAISKGRRCGDIGHLKGWAINARPLRRTFEHG